MKIIKNTILLCLMAFVPSALCAQEVDAVKLLDKAVATIKADAGVQMDFKITLFDASGEEMYDEKGFLKIDGERFALLTDQMKLWCDGETQWSYIAQNNEIYISEPNAEDARAFSPLHIMQLYKNGFRSEFMKRESTAKVAVVKMTATNRGSDIRNVLIHLSRQTFLPVMLNVEYDNGSSARINIDSYKSKCKFAVKEFRCREKDFRGAEVVDMR